MTEAVILIGPPAIGKGEILKRFRAIAKCIEVKSLILEAINLDSAFRDEAEDIMSRGALLPDDMINRLLKARLDKVSHMTTSTVVIDGSCRNMAQTKFLRDYLVQNHFTPNFMIFSLESDDEFYELCRSRVERRIALSKPGEVRSDDKISTHKVRFDLYMQEIDHIEAYLLRVVESHIHFIDPRGSVDSVYSQIFVNTGVGVSTGA